MSDQATDKDTTEDYSDLGFDVERHREALGAFAALDLHPESIKPALIARNLVLYEVTQGKFSIDTTIDIEEQEKAERAQAAIAFKVLYQSGNSRSVERVRSDVEKYFLTVSTPPTRIIPASHLHFRLSVRPRRGTEDSPAIHRGSEFVRWQVYRHGTYSSGTAEKSRWLCI